MYLSEMWEWFRDESGADSLAALRAQYGLASGSEAVDDPEVEAILLRDVRFFSTGESVEVPIDPVRFVLEAGAYFDLDGRSDTDPIVRAVLTYMQPGHSDSADEVVQAVLGKIRGQAKSVVARIGQQAFKAMVSEAYGHHCALTGDKVRPVLEAAHIRSYSSGGEYRLDNGILLRSDMHTLYDRGFISFDLEVRLMVSPQLRERFGNGDWLYARAGQSISLPERVVDRPNPDFLQWHHEKVYLDW
jgi:putative restriction endonuclease